MGATLVACFGASFLIGATTCFVSFGAGLDTAAGLLVFGAVELDDGAGRGFGAAALAMGFFTGCAIFGSGTSGLSAVFAAEEVVGRIILARKESGAGVA